MGVSATEMHQALVKRIEELEQSLSSLRQRVVANEERAESAVPAAESIPPPVHVEPQPLPRPFEVDYDPDEEEYYVFAPEGCVLVDGEAAEIKGADSKGNVSLDFTPEGLPDYLWGHVTEKSSASGGYEVEFDGEPTKSGAKWNFRVVRFGEEEMDGNQYDVATSVVSFSTGEDAVVPDDVSTEFIPDPPEGEDPDGDEGRLQIKGFKAGSPAYTNTVADYLDGTAALPQAGIFLIAREGSTGGSPALVYIPLAALSDPYGKDAGISVSSVSVSGTSAHPNGGVEITFQPLQDGQPVGQPEVVTIWHGNDGGGGGGGGGADLSNDPPEDVVPSGAGADAGSAATASRSDHVHEMPAEVMLTDVNQDVTARKTFVSGSSLVMEERVRIYLRTVQGSDNNSFYMSASDSGSFQLTARVASSDQRNVLVANIPGKAITLGYADLNIVQVAAAVHNALPAASAITNDDRYKVATLKWTDDNYQHKRTGTREYVEDVKYDTGSKRLMKKVMVENLATGAVSPKTGTGYDAQGWTMITGGQATPHSAEA